MAVFFTADTHFGHAGARSLFRRPFDSVAEMDEAMVAAWNETVAPDDEVWHLGDFAVRLSVAEMGTLLASLHGRKHLIVGNNDPAETRALSGWVSVTPYAEIVVDEARLVLCHYPFRSWNGMHKGSINLHGHSHGRLKGLTRQMDVGVDCWNFRPVTLNQLLRKGRR